LLFWRRLFLSSAPCVLQKICCRVSLQGGRERVGAQCVMVSVMGIAISISVLRETDSVVNEVDGDVFVFDRKGEYCSIESYGTRNQIYCR
jgi:hypothetical protein